MPTWIVIALTVAAAGDPAAGDPPAGDPPGAPGAFAPNLTVVDGGVVLTWLEPLPDRPDDDGHALRFARCGEKGWSAPRTIIAGDEFFANWADVPSLAVTNDERTWIAHWPQRSGAGTYAYDVVVARSDEGRTWTTLGPLHDDGTETEHGFVSMIPAGDAIRAIWLDGRAMATDDGGAPMGSGDMTLRSTRVGDAIGQTEILDARVCECCNTAAAVTSRGPVVVYRDRASDETRDIAVVRHTGATWTDPVAVHADGWRIAGCPVNGPAIAARGEQVVVAWFTGATEEGAVRVAFSSDAGATFAAPVTVDGTWPTGRVGVTLRPEGDALVSWLDTHGDGGAIVLRRVHPDGRQGATIAVAATSLARASGFPRLAPLDDDRVIVVWTEAGKVSRLRAVVIRADSIP